MRGLERVEGGKTVWDIMYERRIKKVEHVIVQKRSASEINKC